MSGYGPEDDIRRSIGR